MSLIIQCHFTPSCEISLPVTQIDGVKLLLNIMFKMKLKVSSVLSNDLFLIIQGDLMNIFIGVKGVFYSVGRATGKYATLSLGCLAFSGYAAASEPKLGVVEVIPSTYENFKEIDECPGINGTPAPQGRIKFCDIALSNEKIAGNNLTRSRFLFYRSSAKIDQRDYIGAIADADQATALDDRARTFSYAFHNQRCWARALANIEIDVAWNACLEAVRLKGPNYFVIDSMALVALRRGDWQAAVSAYYVSHSVKKTAISFSGIILSLTGYRNSRQCPEWCKPGTDEQIASVRNEASASDLEVGQEFFDEIGLTVEGVKQMAAKEEASILKDK